jgi:hypothetical protein
MSPSPLPACRQLPMASVLALLAACQLQPADTAGGNPVDAAWPSGARPVAVTLAAQIKDQLATPAGPAQRVRRLDSDAGYAHPILRAIETADPAWLEIARRLRVEADAGVAQSLNQALARALPKAPERVLAMVGNGVVLEQICTSPFIEPAPGVAQAYAEQTLAALATVSQPELRPLAQACMQRVRGSAPPPR